jgi:HSP20 family molecular chaperone IbpA
MGIIEKVTALLPTRSEQQDRRAPHTQALALKDDFDSWLTRFFEEPWGYTIDYPGIPLPEVRETDREFVVRVDVPGFDRSDLDLSLNRGALVIRAHRHEDGREQSMAHTVSLPPDIDPDEADARVERGVLTVRFPRRPSSAHTRRIPVST